MRFMMLMIPKGYETAAPGTMPDDIKAPMQAIVDTMPDEQRGAGILGLAVAVGSWRPRINFLPRALRPRRASPSQMGGRGC